MDASVVVPLYNGRDSLPMQLDALARQDFTGSWEVIIVNNRSTDGGDVLAWRWRDRLPGLQVIDAAAGRGTSYARNVGVQHVQGRLVVFCDADDEVDDGWLSAMVAGGALLDMVGGSGDARRLNSPSVRWWYARNDERVLGVLGDPNSDLRGGDAADCNAVVARPALDLPRVLEFLPFTRGNNFAVRRDVLEELGGFDESFFGGGDDVDISWRAALAGYRVGPAADAIVYVRLRSSLPGLAKQQYWYGRTAVRLYRKFRSAGMPGRPLILTLKTWAWLAVHVVYLAAGTDRRGRWVRLAAVNTGRLVGSLQLRVRYL